MTVSSEYFAMAATAFKKFYPDPPSLTINTDAHVCPTYVATVSSAKDEPFILQFRIREHALVDPATYEVVEKSLGSFAPKIKLLGEHEHEGVTYLVYEMSKLPGEPLARLIRKNDVLPVAAEGVGRLLASCIIPGTRCGSEKEKWVDKVMKELESGLASTVPELEPYKSEMARVRDAVLAGGLDDLPLAVSNGDMNMLNILATKDGKVGGLVDWDARVFEIQPLGMWLAVVLMSVKCRPREGFYEEYENTAEIEARFWKGFFSMVPHEVAAQRDALALAMKLGAIVYEIGWATEAPEVVPHLRWQLNCEIPSLSASGTPLD